MIDILNIAKKEFGITYNWRCTGYLLPDGAQLDFSEDHCGYRTRDHREIKILYSTNTDNRFDNVVKFMNTGSIRISPESGGICLTILPTIKQLAKLKLFVKYMGGEVYVDICNTQTGDVITSGYYDNARPDRVVNDIFRYFTDGIKIIGDTINESLSTPLLQEHKLKQLNLILKTNPANDTYHTWIRTLHDIKTYEEAITSDDYDTDYAPDYTYDDVNNILRDGHCIVYSSYPILPGTFVTPSKMEAAAYCGHNNVYQKKVNLLDVAWIDGMEGQYAPVKLLKL